MNRNLRFQLYAITMVAGALGATTLAQRMIPLPPPGPGGPPGDVVVAGPGIGGVSLFSEGETVKGAPFSARMVTRQRQTFADGNEVLQTSASVVYRDSQGRVRREVQMMLPGPLATANGRRTLISISDPVAQSMITLDPNERIAYRMPLPGLAPAPEPSVGAANDDVLFLRPSESPSEGVFGVAVNAPALPLEKGKSQDLGEQTIGGVLAKGTRLTTTIEQNRIGNAKPIKIVTESWYSPELRVVVRSIHGDPWAGRIETNLESLVRGEPHQGLFIIPPDYRIIEKRMGEAVEIQLEGRRPQ